MKELKKNSFKINQILFIFLCFLFSFLLVACSFSDTNYNDSSNDYIQEQQKNPLEVVNSDWKSDEYGYAYIEGIVKNNSNKEFSYVEISFNLYDKDGNIITSEFTNVTHLDPYGTWKYKVTIWPDDAKKTVKYTLNKIYGH